MIILNKKEMKVIAKRHFPKEHVHSLADRAKN